MSRYKKYLYIAVFLLISLVIMGKLFKAGYILALDMDYGPYTPKVLLDQYIFGLKTNFGLSGPVIFAESLYSIIVYSGSFIAPAWFWQTLFLTAFLFLAGVGMYRLVPSSNSWAKYFAGLLYMVNPFFYVRYLAGHFYLLSSYALLPWAVKSFIRLMEEPSFKQALKVSLWLTLIAPSWQTLVMAVGILFLFFVIKLLKKGDRRRLALHVAETAGLFGLFNVGWVYSTVLGHSVTTEALSTVTHQDLSVFATSTNPNMLFNVAGMYGFWRPGYDYPKDHLWGWQFLFLIILFLATSGWLMGQKGRGRIYVNVIALLIPVSIILATGVSEPHIGKFYLFLYDHVPLFKGFREPFKFAQLLPFCYAFLGSIAVDGIANFFKSRRVRFTALIIALLVPVIYTYSMFWGFGGQLKNLNFPSDYYQVAELIKQQKGEFSTLFFPWHGWMVYDWAGETLGYQAQSVFPSPITICSDTIEAGGIYTESTNPVSHYIEAILAQSQKIDNLGELIAPLKVKYAVLEKEADWQEYSFLLKQKDLQLVQDLPTISVFSNLYSGEVSNVFLKAESEINLSPGLALQVKAAVDSYRRNYYILLWPAISFVAFAGAIVYQFKDRIRHYYKKGQVQ